MSQMPGTPRTQGVVHPPLGTGAPRRLAVQPFNFQDSPSESMRAFPLTLQAADQPRITNARPLVRKREKALVPRGEARPRRGKATGLTRCVFLPFFESVGSLQSVARPTRRDRTRERQYHENTKERKRGESA